MKNMRTKTLAIAICMVLAMTQVLAEKDVKQAEISKEEAKIESVDMADKITKLIWEDSKNTKLTQKSDDITNLAWSSTADYELVAQADYKPVAFAADLEEENNLQKQDEADKITRKIWAN